MTGLHYLLWVLLTIPVVGQLRRIWKDPREVLSPLAVVTMGFFFLYVVAYFALDARSKAELLSNDGYLLVLTLACASWLFFYIGYRLASVPSRARFPALDLQRTEVIAFLYIVTAGLGWAVFLDRSGGFAAYYGSPHGAAGAWAETSAYIYTLRMLFFPALYLLIALHLQAKPSPIGTVLMAGVACFLLADAWWQGSRGTWIRLLVVALVATILLDLTRKVLRKRALIIPPIVVALIVLTPYIRSAMHLGAERSVLTAVEEVLGEVNPLAGSAPGEGNELVYASALVSSAATTNTLDYGYQWIYPVIAFVPRFWWPDKPLSPDWSIDYRELVFSRQGWLVAPGAAPTGLADAFLRFSWFSPLVWLFLGLWGAPLWSTSKTGQHPADVGYLCAYHIGLVYMITQSFEAAFYGWAFFVGPILVWATLTTAQLPRQTSPSTT